MSGAYGATDERESIATIHAAMDHGIELIDTGDFYGAGRNELLIGRALRDRRSRVLLSVKFGSMRSPRGEMLGFDGRPLAVKNFLTYSLARLGVDYIDIYRPARLDPSVPIEETVGAIADLVKAGYVRSVGLSEVAAETIRRAHEVHPIVDVQIEYSLISRSPEAKVLPAVRELGVGVTAYGVLSRGLLGGSRPAPAADFRALLPRFSAANRVRNDAVVESLREMAKANGGTAAQLAIAWVLAKGDDIVPVIGVKTRTQLTGALGALDLELETAELDRIEKTIHPNSIEGTRYPEHMMHALDSER